MTEVLLVLVLVLVLVFMDLLSSRISPHTLPAVVVLVPSHWVVRLSTRTLRFTPLGTPSWDGALAVSLLLWWKCSSLLRARAYLSLSLSL